MTARARAENKKPRMKPGLSCRAGAARSIAREDRRAGTEFVIEAGAEDIGAKVHVDRPGRAAIADAAAGAAEIDIEIFELGGPVAGDGEFHAAAERPAGAGAARFRQRIEVRADLAEGKTAGEIRHEAVAGEAEAPARGAEPRIFRDAAGARAGRGRAAVVVRPAEIGFQAPDPDAVLHVEADGAADQPAGGVEIGGAGRPLRVAPDAAAIDAEIDAAPVEGGNGDRRRHRRHARRQIGGEGCERGRGERRRGKARSDRCRHHVGPSPGRMDMDRIRPPDAAQNSCATRGSLHFTLKPKTLTPVCCCAKPRLSRSGARPKLGRESLMRG